ncbi:MAG: hypothetical protein H6713_26725 [Myxococcales bacterium]|nr:hypothetical protein [Myxococcales bacterium]
MSDGRRYDEREVGLILKRALELQAREADRGDARSMSEAELEEVVHELGISKALVKRAASEVAIADVRNRPVWWLGGKTELMFEEVVEGTIDDATLTQMIEVLRRSLADPGELKREGPSRIWSVTKAQGGRRVHLSVVEHGETTTLRLEEAAPVDARATVGGAAGMGGFAGIMSVIPLKALVVKAVLMLALGPMILLGATVGWLGGRAVWARVIAGREQQLRQAFAEIVALARGRTRALPEVADG